MIIDFDVATSSVLINDQRVNNHLRHEHTFSKTLLKTNYFVY